MKGPVQDSARFSDNSKGAALMTAASLAFVLNDFMMKLVFAELSVAQGVFLRGLLVCPLLILICLQRHQLFVAVPRGDRSIIVCRTALEITITFLFLLALSQLSLAHVTAVLSCSHNSDCICSNYPMGTSRLAAMGSSWHRLFRSNDDHQAGAGWF